FARRTLSSRTRLVQIDHDFLGAWVDVEDKGRLIDIVGPFEEVLLLSFVSDGDPILPRGNPLQVRTKCLERSLLVVVCGDVAGQRRFPVLHHWDKGHAHEVVIRYGEGRSPLEDSALDIHAPVTASGAEHHTASAKQSRPAISHDATPFYALISA